MARMKIMVDLEDLRLVLQAFQERAPRDVLELHRYMGEVDNPVRRLTAEYQDYQRLVSTEIREGRLLS